MGEKGIDFVVKINTGTVQTPTWTTIAGARGGTLTVDTDTIDVSDKDGSGWEEHLAGLRSWSIDHDGMTDETDLGLEKLNDEALAGNQVGIQFVTPSGRTYDGQATITSFTLDAPHDGAATAAATFQGTGALTQTG